MITSSTKLSLGIGLCWCTLVFIPWGAPSSAQPPDAVEPEPDFRKTPPIKLVLPKKGHVDTGPQIEVDDGTPVEVVLPAGTSAIKTWSWQRFSNGEFDLLDEAATLWRDSKIETRDGDWNLTAMYDGIGTFPGKGGNNAGWLLKAREWVKLRPNSITARVALAVILTKYAWQARGNGFASTVSDLSWQLFHQRLGEARLVLREAKTLKAKCPHWWAAAQVIARGQGWPEDACDGLLQEAVAFEPGYAVFYKQHLVSLLPRWGGADGAALRFANDQVGKKGGSKGDLLYGQLILQYFWYEGARSYQPAISFERLDRGFKLMEESFPQDNPYLSKTIWSYYCHSTGTPENGVARKARARQLLEQILDLPGQTKEKWPADLKHVHDWANQQ